MLNLPVSEFMNDHPIKVRADVSIRNIAHLMLRYRVNGIVVVQHDDEDKVIGVFTTTDLVNIINEAMDKGAHRIQALNAVSNLPVTHFLTNDFTSLQKR